jgi:hypothetical protein
VIIVNCHCGEGEGEEWIVVERGEAALKKVLIPT